MNAILVRNEVTDDAVLGYLYADGTCFATLEPAWRHNVRNISCIPAGDYQADYLPRSASENIARFITCVTSPAGAVF